MRGGSSKPAKPPGAVQSAGGSRAHRTVESWAGMAIPGMGANPDRFPFRMTPARWRAPPKANVKLYSFFCAPRIHRVSSRLSRPGTSLTSLHVRASRLRARGRERKHARPTLGIARSCAAHGRLRSRPDRCAPPHSELRASNRRSTRKDRAAANARRPPRALSRPAHRRSGGHTRVLGVPSRGSAGGDAHPALPVARG